MKNISNVSSFGVEIQSSGVCFGLSEKIEKHNLLFCLPFVHSITTKCSNWNLLVVRSLSGKDDKKGDGDKDASNKVANVNKKREPFRLENASKKLETLAANAKDFKSISAKDDKSVSKVMGKPKYFVRVSARSEEDKRKAMPVETIEPLSKYVGVCFVFVCCLTTFSVFHRMASGLDKRLVEAAKRVAKKIPNRIKSKLTEKELIDSLNEQKIETEKAKYDIFGNRSISFSLNSLFFLSLDNNCRSKS